jgi:cytochrome P450
MVFTLAERPDVWDGVRDGRFEVAAVVEEVLRHRSTVTSLGRRVAETLTVDGETLPAGEQVILSLWSADHDEAAYPAPERFAPETNVAAQHFAFGHGPHHCLGAALARAELQEALAVLAARITCPVPGPDQQWKPPIGITGPERLPITFTAR